jgi:SAGA-associated factor 29
MSTQRNRAARSGPRSNGAETGEEQQIWASAKDIIKGVMVKVTELERIREKIVSRETDIKDKGLTNQDKRDLEDLYRQSVKTAEEVADTLKNDDTGLLQQLDILKVLMAHNDVPAAELPRRGATAIAREARERSAIADLDGSIDSPAPSPVVEKPSRKDRTASSRSSLPPKEVPIKKEDTEPPRSAVAEPAGATAKQGKITFAMDEEVAFKPKASGAEEHEWIQGRVVRIIGEGKSRRYDVLDPEPEDTKKHGSIYRTSASSMVAIPPEGAALPDYPKGKHVLARYPQTTAFYRAEVVGMATDKVLLKFEGEETASMVKEVDRRFVLDHRG